MGRVVIRRGRIEAKASTPEKRKHNWISYDSQRMIERDTLSLDVIGSPYSREMLVAPVREYVEGSVWCTVCGKTVEARVLMPEGHTLLTGLENVREEIMAKWADENVGPCG